MSTTVPAAIATAAAANPHVRQGLLQSAVKSVSAALKAGIVSENAIVAGVKALTFMALDRIGSEMIADGYDVKTSRAFSGPYTMVINYLVNDNLIVFRGSEDSFAELVKDRRGKDRVEGIRKYVKTNKGKDLVWTVAQIRAMSRKIIAATTAETNEDGREFCRALSRAADVESRVALFDDFYVERFGKTYKDLNTALANPSKPRDEETADKAMMKAFGAIMDVDRLERLAAALAAQIDVAKRQAENAREVLPDTDSEDNVLRLLAA